MGDGGFRIIGDEDFGDPAKKLKGMGMGANPGREILREGGLREGIMAGTEGGHKEIGFLDLSCKGILNRNGLTGIIDK
jgi:hypothetical protein